MRRLTPIGFGDFDQYGGVSGDVGFWFDDRGALLWLRTIEGIWLAADMEAPYWWTLDVNNMPAVNLAHLHAATLALLQQGTARAQRSTMTSNIERSERARGLTV